MRRKEAAALSKLKRILFGTDFTPASRKAFEEALSLCRETGAELLLAHVYSTPASLPAELALTPDTYEQLDEKLREDAQAKLRALGEEARRVEVRERTFLLSGAPDEALVEAAGQTGVDLVVLGTHGRTGAARFFLGSVASKVIATASCPVLTVRAA